MANTGRVLVVDDEHSLLIVMEQYLRRLGHEVVACRDGEEAWRAFKEEPESFRLVLADLTLPVMSGTELLTRMLHLNPGILILICSGYPFDISVLPAAHQHQVGFLQKPFTPRMLADSIDQLLAPRNGEEPPA